MNEPVVAQMYLTQLTLDEFYAVFHTYLQYVDHVWFSPIDHLLNISLISIPLFILPAITETIRSVTKPEAIGEPTHE